MSDPYGLHKRLHESADGATLTVEVVQDVEPYLERNARAMNAYNGRGPTRSETFKEIGDVPNVVIERWLRDYGVNIYDPNHLPRVRQLLRDPDWLKLRTCPGRI